MGKASPSRYQAKAICNQLDPTVSFSLGDRFAIFDKIARNNDLSRAALAKIIVTALLDRPGLLATVVGNALSVGGGRCGGQS